MASQIYSRYVPPPRKKQESKVESLVQVSVASSPPPVTAPDASSTYARYIPPSKKKHTSLEPSQHRDQKDPSSKSKRTIEDVEGLQEPLPTTPKKNKKRLVPAKESIDLQEGDAGQKRKSQKGTARALNQKDEEAAVQSKRSNSSKNESIKEDGSIESSESIALPNNVADNEETKHRKLMRKREKSLKRAGKLAETTHDSIDQDGDHIMTEPSELHDLIPLPQPEPVPELPPVSTADSLPIWLASPIGVTQTSTAEFESLGLRGDVIKTLKERGFHNAFAVQAAVLPLLLPEATRLTGDIVVSAPTGSGKTLAYLLPMIKDISRFQVSKLRGLIVLPTRELVAQAKEVAEMCATAFSTDQRRVRVGTAVGNDALKTEQISLMDQECVYDPEAYDESLKNANRQWEVTEDVDGGTESLLEEKPISKIPGHVERPRMKVNVLICTPGRLVEHIKSTSGFTLNDISWLVVDEADKLLDQSYQQWLGQVMAGIGKKDHKSLSRGSRVQKVILSATMTRDLGQLNELKLYRPKLIVLESLAERSEISQSFVLPILLMESAIKVEETGIKPLYLIKLLKLHNIISQELRRPEEPDHNDSTSESISDSSLDSGSGSSDTDSSEDVSVTSKSLKELVATPKPVPFTDLNDPRGVLIFTKSNESAVRLGRLIALLSPPQSSAIGVLTSTLPRSSRHRTLQSFAKGKISILVASDLVSRGLDLPNLAHVVNYDVPSSLTSYVHRIGRTARAGKKGHAWTLFTDNEGRWFWNEIGRSEQVQRQGGKIDRFNLKIEEFDAEERAKYERALEELGKEASRTAA